jgi:hypothetical protein
MVRTLAGVTTRRPTTTTGHQTSTSRRRTFVAPAPHLLGQPVAASGPRGPHQGVARMTLTVVMAVGTVSQGSAVPPVTVRTGTVRSAMARRGMARAMVAGIAPAPAGLAVAPPILAGLPVAVRAVAGPPAAPMAAGPRAGQPTAAPMTAPPRRAGMAQYRQAGIAQCRQAGIAQCRQAGIAQCRQAGIARRRRAGAVAPGVRMLDLVATLLAGRDRAVTGRNLVRRPATGRPIPAGPGPCPMAIPPRAPGR